VRRRCAYGGFISPFQVQTLAGIPCVHRYRCGCTTKFDIVTGVGRFLLAAINFAIGAALLLVPKEKFASSSDRMWILIVIIGVQIPLVAFFLFRSAQNARRYPLTPA